MRKVLMAGLVGVAIGLLGWGHRGGALWVSPRHLPDRFLILDSGLGEASWLDDELQATRRIECPRLCAAALSGAFVWMGSAPEGWNQAPYRLVAFRGENLAASVQCPPILGMVQGPLPGEVCILLRPEPGEECLARVDPSGSLVGVLDCPGADQVLTAGGVFWILDHAGGAWSWEFHPHAPPNPRAWSLAGAIRRARVVDQTLWIALDAVGTPWCRVDALRGAGPLRAAPWMPKAVRAAPPTAPLRRAWLEATQIEGNQSTGWLLVEPDALWTLDPDGTVRTGQGFFGYIERALCLPRNIHEHSRQKPQTASKACLPALLGTLRQSGVLTNPMGLAPGPNRRKVPESTGL